MHTLHNNLHNLLQIFGLNSATSPLQFGKWLMVYNAILMVAYATVVFLRCHEGRSESLYAVNNVTVTLQLMCYVIIFLSNIISNCFGSKKFLQSLNRLSVFDENLRKHGHRLNWRKMNKVFYVSLCASSGLLFYILVVDYVVDVAVDNHISIVYWLSVYLPLISNYFLVYVVVLLVYFLRVRYSLLSENFRKILNQENSDDASIRNFENFFVELTNISNSILSQFSLQVGIMFLTSFITITSSLYLSIRGDFSSSQHLVIINFMSVHAVEMMTIIWTYYGIGLKIGDIINNAPQLLTLGGLYRNHFKELVGHYLLIDKTVLDVTVFGMFRVSPSTLLSIVSWIASYLVILIQFTPEKHTLNEANTLWKAADTSRIFLEN
ncbi:7tm 7 domain containing protein [Asbolus verrucosus]|uniref:Gustatory receptor n=1 Tax=Asbolus verrucosus TaxID=1661398 RepID=A0A482VZV8_ASBVE|nr:7tm 7 domain containing protein [Asbolus verrucosus]